MHLNELKALHVSEVLKQVPIEPIGSLPSVAMGVMIFSKSSLV